MADGAKDRHDDQEKDDEEEEEEEVEEESLLKEFEEETAGLMVPSEQIQEIKEEMQKEFHNIIDEVPRADRPDRHLPLGSKNLIGSWCFHRLIQPITGIHFQCCYLLLFYSPPESFLLQVDP